MKKYGLWLAMLALLGCTSKAPESRVDEPLVDGKYRLSADREALDKLREQVPAEKRQENDEIAFAMQWMGDVKRPPSEVRNKFDSAVSKKRSSFNKDMERMRTDFVRHERRDRETFTRETENSRKSFASLKRTPDDRKKFFEDLDQKRKDFYAAQREKRDAFEADMRDRRKNFDDYIREKNADFQQEHRAYSKRYDDMKKDETKKRQNPQPSTYHDDHKIDAVPAEPLGAGQ